MARCAKCDGSIHYGRYWLSLLTNSGRNMLTRSKVSPIITCPHCGQDNVQMPVYIAIQFAIVIGIIASVFFVAGDRVQQEPLWIVSLIGGYIVFEGLWWTFAARLKKLGE